MVRKECDACGDTKTVTVRWIDQETGMEYNQLAVCPECEDN